VDLYTPARKVFAAVVDALGFTGDGALTKIDLSAAIPTFDTQPSVESAQVRYSEFVLLRTDAGAITSGVDIDPHVLGDWTEILNRGRILIGVGGSAVPDDHDAWVVRAGVMGTVAASFTDASIFTTAATTGSGSAQMELFFADTSDDANRPVFRAATHESPILIPLPWWVPPVDEQTGSLRFRLVTSAAVSTNLTLGILSAPRGVLRRMY